MESSASSEQPKKLMENNPDKPIDANCVASVLSGFDKNSEAVAPQTTLPVPARNFAPVAEKLPAKSSAIFRTADKKPVAITAAGMVIAIGVLLLLLKPKIIMKKDAYDRPSKTKICIVRFFLLYSIVSIAAVVIYMFAAKSLP